MTYRHKPAEAAKPVAGVQPGDHVYFRDRASKARKGEVLCGGRDGFSVRCEKGMKHDVTWDRYLAHHSRKPRAAKLLSQGDEASLLELETGERAVLNHSESAMSKSCILFFRKADPIANRPGLTLQDVTDNRGHETKRWKRSGDKPAAEREQRGSSKGYGTRRVDIGDAVHFEADDGRHISGSVTSAGSAGARVKSADGAEHKVIWDKMRKPPEPAATPQTRQQMQGRPGASSGANWRAAPPKIHPDQFKAAEHFDQHDRKDVTADSVRAALPPETAKRMQDAKDRLASIEETQKQHKVGGQYTAERQALHHKIIYGSDEKDEAGRLKHPGLLHPDRVAAATPAAGAKPRFTVLGGRGGSGKGHFKGVTYDPDKSIALDADEIKRQLPEYEGWNAHQVHEESGDIFDRVTEMAKQKGLNIVHDATMKTPHKAVSLVKDFKHDGYDVAAHYMHLPRHMAAERAVKRFEGKEGRLVPPEVILGNTQNERAFDAVREHAGEWSFWDNQGDDGPQLISHSHAGTGKMPAGKSS